MKEAIITFFGQKVKVNCDSNCCKAWGSNLRPNVKLSDDEDDWTWLADNELGEAPTDPGSYEGGHAKPKSSNEFPNKWCVRECERCNMSNPGQYNMPLKVRTFDKRFYNIKKERK
ncbi:MAG: hypothetical protein ACTSO3_01290 [Candidatus Heimdallarchaeaceae archaeon]